MAKANKIMKFDLVKASGKFVLKDIGYPAASPSRIILKNYIYGVHPLDGLRIKGTKVSVNVIGQ